MLRVLGLHQYPPALGPPPGPARDLGDELEGPLGRAEIREMKASIGVDHPNQSHVRKVDALGDHLGPDQHVDLALADPFEDPVMRPFRPRGIEVHPRNPGPRHPFRNHLLDLLGPDPARS